MMRGCDPTEFQGVIGRAFISLNSLRIEKRKRGRKIGALVKLGDPCVLI